MPGYEPGVCNIGRNEIRKRYALAAVGFVIAAIASYAIISFNLPRLVLLVSFIPLLMGFEGFYQGYLKFCAGFAAASVYDFTGSGGSRSQVTDPESHKKDMTKAIRIHLYSIISSIIIVAIIYFAL
jgi:hypothetical protein